MSRHQLAYTDPRDLRPNPFNPNVVDPINQAKLVNSLRKHSFFRPIIVRSLPDGSLEVIGGEHRMLAAIEIGMTEVPIINLGEISDDKAKEILLLDNSRYGEDDPELMQALLESGFGTAEELLSVLPIDEEELASYFSKDALDAELDALDQLDNESDTLNLDLPTTSIKSHQILRFKVPTEDAETIEALIEKAQREQGFQDGDSLANAGDALVWLLLSGAK